MITWQMVVRDLLRNRWRSGLSMGGIAVATAILIWNMAFFDGFFDLMVRGSTEVDIGHVQIQDRDYVEQPATIDYFEWDDEIARAVGEVDQVVAVAPRVHLFGLIGHEDRSQVGRIMGIDPGAEAQVTVMAEGVRQGRWLSEEVDPEGVAEVVLGHGLAQSLGVGVGDELVVIAEGVDGSMGDGLLEVVGVVRTGNSRIDRQAALLHLEEAQFIAAMEGAVHEAVVRVRNPAQAPMVAAVVQSRLDGEGLDELVARPWQQVEPGLYEMLAYGNQMNGVIFGIIFLVVSLGVLNALRMSARERMREFGVMLAVGMSRARLFVLVCAEGFILGVVGALLGGLVGGAITYYHTTRGIDFSPFLEGEGTWMGVSFTERIYFVMDAGTVLMPVVGLIAVTTVCAIWPAIASVRLNPRDAISGRT